MISPGLPSCYSHTQSAPLTAPTEVTGVDVLGLTVRAVDVDSIRLRWLSQPGDSLYSVYESSSAFGPFELLVVVDTNRATLPVGDVPRCFFQVRRFLEP